MKKNTIIAVALSAVVYILWAVLFMPKGNIQPPIAPNTSTPAPVTETSGKSETANPVVSTETGKLANPTVDTSVAGVKAAKTEESATVSTKYYTAVLSNKGAKITSILYGSRRIQLAGVEINGEAGDLDFPIHFAEKEFLSGNSLQSALWSVKTIDDRTIAFSIPLTISGVDSVVEKTYQFDEKNPFFIVTYRITNLGKTPITFPENRILVSPSASIGPKVQNPKNYLNQLTCVYYADGSMEKGKKGGGFFSTETSIKSFKDYESHWYGIISRYFSVIMIPQDENAHEVIWDSRGAGGYRIGGSFPIDKIEPNKTYEKRFKVALAEKEKDILATVDPGIVSATNVSKWIEPLRNGILWCLLMINKLFGNFGVSIIVLSIITKCLFLPLTIKSTESMKKMGELAPEIKKLKERYKDKSPQELQKATMELYAKNKVSPMSGCLPLLLQMPFFIALYSSLSTSFALCGTPFVFWIKDLSHPDTLFMIGTFSVNILPLIMTGSQFIQQKMTSMDSAATGSQQMMMKLMPIMFIFFFWNMPSGLTLYWSVQNILQIGHQYYVNHRKKKKAQLNNA